MNELQVIPVAWCLLPNHYHWLVRQDGENRAGLFPQRIFNSYTKAYNKRFDHSGTIFEGPYKAKLVTDKRYLHQLMRYVHFNAVKHGFVNHPDAWRWSNWHECSGLREGMLYDSAFIEAEFGGRSSYREWALK